MQIDHVVYAVADLDAAERHFAVEHGLAASGGGDHPQFGTRNRILPVGYGQYVELMAVAEPSSQHPLARAIVEATRQRDRSLALCLRPDDLDDVAARLSIEVRAGERRNPGGEVLRWRLAGLDEALGPERLPFFIDWQGLEERLDAQHAKAATTDGIEWVEHGGDAARLAEWIGGDEAVKTVGGDPGPQAIALRRAVETLVIR